MISIYLKEDPVWTGGVESIEDVRLHTTMERIRNSGNGSMIEEPCSPDSGGTGNALAVAD